MSTNHHLTNNPTPAGHFPLMDGINNEQVINLQAHFKLVSAINLGYMSLSTQGSADVLLPGIGSIPIGLYIMCSASPGSGKSTIESHSGKGVTRFEQDIQTRFKEAQKIFEVETELWREEKRALKKTLEKSIGDSEIYDKAKLELKEHIKNKPIKPRQHKFCYERTTSTAFLKGLQKNGNLAAIISAEGDSILNGDSLRDLPMFNAAWSGSRISKETSEDSIVIEEPRVGMTLSFQPSSLVDFNAKHGTKAKGNGFLSRTLCFNSVSTQGSRFIRSTLKSTKNTDRFNDRCYELLQQYVEASDSKNFKRKLLKFTPEAEQAWINYFNNIECQLGPQGFYRNAPDHGARLPEMAGRVSAVIHEFEGFDGDISLSTLNRAIQICNDCSTDFFHLFLPPPQEYIDADRLYQWLQSQYLNFGVRYVKRNTVRQFCPNPLRKKNRLDECINVLVNQRCIGLATIKKTNILDLTPQNSPVSVDPDSIP